MSNFNKVILLGNVTRDFETRHTQGGMMIAKFGMAVNRNWTQNGERKESTCFVDLTVFGKTAELMAQHLRKGSPVFVEGRLELQQWEDKEGNKRSKHEVVVENFQFVGGRGDGEDAAPAQTSRRAPARRSQPDMDDVPF